MTTAHTHVLNVLLALFPDLFLCWAAMRLTDNQWSSFWIAFFVLQAIYFFFWAKTALWSWLLFWFIGKRQMAAHLENSFVESRFPAPTEFTLDLDDYLSGIIDNEKLDCATRIRAAHENGTLNGMKVSRRYSLVMQINAASKLALKRYAKLATRCAQDW